MAGGTVNLAVKTTNDSSGLKAASADLESFGKSAAAAGTGLDAFDKKQAAAAKNLESNITKASAVASVGLLAIGGLAIKTAADFERSMDQVGAVAGATATEMGQLSAAAKTIGAETAFSASQAAGAMQELAAGSRSVTQILNGEARAAVDLAAAGNYDLAQSGRTIATVMDVWKNTQIDTNDVVNRLAGAANASRFGVEDMSAAVAQAGGVAASMGVEFDDFTAAIAATASSFASGSDAGTSYKTFLLGLDGSTDKAKQKIEELNLQFRDQEGHLKGTAEIAQELADKVGVLGEAEQVAALKTIFGNDAYRTAVGLMNQTADGVQKVNDVLANTDAGAIAEQRMSNLAGSFEEFKGSAETLAISIGEKALPAMTALTEFGTNAMNAFGGLPESTQGTALGAVALAASAPAAAAGIEKMAGAARALSTGAASASLQAGALGLGIGAITVAADFLLQKTTGRGLFDYLLGDVSKMDAYEAAAEDIADSLYGVADPAERVAILTRDVATATSDWERRQKELNAALGVEKLYDRNAALNAAAEATEMAEEKVRALGEAMIENNASTAELGRVWHGLPAPLQEIFNQATNVENKLSEMRPAANELAVGVWEMTDAFGNWVPEVEAVGEVVPPATSALADFVAGLADGKTLAEELGGQLDILAGRFGSLDPQMAINNVNLAILKEELADVTRAGGEYSDKLGMTVDQMEDAISAIEDNNAALSENEQAYRDLMGSMESLAGAAGIVSGAVLNIDKAIQDANLSAEDQVEVAGEVGQAFGTLASDNIPGFISALQTIGEKSPEVMQTVVDSITDPAQKAAILDHLRGMGSEADTILTEGFGEASNSAVAALNEGLAAGIPTVEGTAGQMGFAAVGAVDAYGDDMYNSGVALGQSAAAGMEAGIYSKSAAVAQAAWDMVAGAIGAANAAQDSRSPSKEYEKLGRYAGEGYVEGLEASEPFVRDASAQMVEAGIEGAAGANDGYGVRISAFDRHGRALTAENGNPMGWVMGSNGAWKWVEIDPNAEPDPEKPIVYGGNDPNTPPVTTVVHPPPPAPPPQQWKPEAPGPGNHPSTPGPGGSMVPGDGTRTADGRVYWDGTGEEPSEPWVGTGALLGQVGAGKQAKQPLVPVGPNLWWDPNIGDFVMGGLLPVEPDSNVGYDPITGELGVIDPVKANYGFSVYQDAQGVWRDVVTNEEAIDPLTGRFKNSRYQQDAVGWLSRLQSDPGKFTGRGMREPVAQQSDWQKFWGGIGMSPRSMSNDPFRMNDFEFFTTKEDWAALGYGEDSEWTSDPWFGFVPKEWLQTADGKRYLAMRGIDPENNMATPGYNTWHPNALKPQNRRAASGGAKAGRRRGGGGTALADPYLMEDHEGGDWVPGSQGMNVTVNINALDATGVQRIVPEIAAEIERQRRRSY